MKPFLLFVQKRLMTFLLDILFIVILIIAIYYNLWAIYMYILLLLVGGFLLFKIIIYLAYHRENIEERMIFAILALGKKTIIEKILLNRHCLQTKPAYHVLRQYKFHEMTQLPIRYLPLTLKIINDNSKIFSSMTPTAQKLVESCVQSQYSPKTLFKIFAYYQLTPRELAQTYIKNHFLAPTARERLIYEAGYEERQLLENNLALNTPLLVQIAEKHQIALNSDYSLLL